MQALQPTTIHGPTTGNRILVLVFHAQVKRTQTPETPDEGVQGRLNMATSKVHPIDRQTSTIHIVEPWDSGIYEEAQGFNSLRG